MNNLAKAVDLVLALLEDAEDCRPSNYPAWTREEVERLSKPIAAALRATQADAFEEAAREVRKFRVPSNWSLLNRIAQTLEARAAELRAGVCYRIATVPHR